MVICSYFSLITLAAVYWVYMFNMFICFAFSLNSLLFNDIFFFITDYTEYIFFPCAFTIRYNNQMRTCKQLHETFTVMFTGMKERTAQGLNVNVLSSGWDSNKSLEFWYCPVLKGYSVDVSQSFKWLKKSFFGLEQKSWILTSPCSKRILGQCISELEVA